MPKVGIVKKDFGENVEAIYIVPLSDLHIGASFNVDEFLKYRDWILAEDNRYCVVNGDIVDNAIADSIGDVYGTMRPAEQKDLAEELFCPLAKAGKILAWVEGNHEFRTIRKTDEFVGRAICKVLGVQDVYHPDGVVMFFSVGAARYKGSTERNRIVYTGFMLHGHAGGRRMGSKANALEDMAKTIVADFYIASHTHRAFAFPANIIMPQTRTKSLSYMKQMFISAGSFAEWDGYAVRKGYNPSDVGSVYIKLDGTKRQVAVKI